MTSTNQLKRFFLFRSTELDVELQV